MINRRPESHDDEDFLQRLITGTVALQLGAQAWPEPMRERLLEIQYQSKRASLKAAFPDGSSQIVVVNGEKVGWLFIADLDNEIRIVEIMISAEHCGRGVGSAIIGEILIGAATRTKPVRLGVSAINDRAIRLYRRLGFRRVSGDEVQWQMEYSPQS